MFFSPSPGTNNVRSIYLSDNKKRTRHKTSALNYMGIISLFGQFLFTFIFSLRNTVQSMWGDRIFEKCGIGRDEGGDDGKTLEIRGKRRLSARDGGANYQQS